MESEDIAWANTRDGAAKANGKYTTVCRIHVEQSDNLKHYILL